MNFIAVDVETANADLASICQIGVARYENGQLAFEWKSYVDPKDYFDSRNMSIHGIDDSMVAGAPTVLPPLKWSSLKYGFDQGGMDRWQGKGTQQKRLSRSYGRSMC